MELEIQRLNFDPITGDNPSEAFLKLDNNMGEIQEAIDDLGGSSTLDVGSSAGTVAAGDDQRFGIGLRNELLNGDLRINQTLFAGGALAANMYGYDMWRTFGAAASLSVSGDRMTITLNGTVGQIKEVPDWANAVLTVSVRNPSGPITVKVQPDATTATAATGVIPAGVGLQSVTLNVPGTLTGNAFVLLTTAAAVTIDGPGKRSGIMVSLGSTPAPFDRLDLGTQLLQCQRYYEKSFAMAVAPGTGQGGAMNQAGTAYSAGILRTHFIPFAVRKATASGIALFTDSLAGTQGGTWARFNGSSYVNGSPTVTSSETGFYVELDFGSGLTAGSSYLIRGHWIANARL